MAKKALKRVKIQKKHKRKAQRPKRAKNKLRRSKKHARNIKRAEQAAKNKGFSLFSWIRRSRFMNKKPNVFEDGKKPLTKKDLKKLNSEIIQKSSVKPIIINYPKFAYHEPQTKETTDPIQTPTQTEIRNEISNATQNDANKILLETQLRNPILYTDLDNILKIVNEEGTVNSAFIQSHLKISSARLKECYKILQDAKKIRIDYPLFGQPKLTSIEFEMEKKRRNQIKRGILPEIADEENEK